MDPRVKPAGHGEATTITKREKPAAVVVPVAAARRLYPTERPSFAALLMGIPSTVEVERDRSLPRESER